MFQLQQDRVRKRASTASVASILNFARSLPTAVTPKLTRNLSAISLRTTSRVHKPKSNPCWRGSLPLIQRKLVALAWARDGAAGRYLSVSAAHASRALHPRFSQPPINHRTSKPVGSDHHARSFALPYALNRHQPDLFQSLVIKRPPIALHNESYVDQHTNATIMSSKIVIISNLQNRIFLSVGGPQHRLRPRKLAQSAAQSQCPRGGAGTRSQDQLKLRLEAAIELSFPFLV